MKKLPFIIVIQLLPCFSGFANSNELKIIEKYEATSLTSSMTINDLNLAKKNAMDLRGFSYQCESESILKRLPISCYLLKEKLKLLGLVLESDFSSATSNYDNQCLILVPNINVETHLPSSLPKSMGPACVEAIKTQKNRLRYIFSAKSSSNLDNLPQ